MVLSEVLNKKFRTNYSIVGKRNVHDVHYHFLTNTEQPLVFFQYSGKEFYSKSLVCWLSILTAMFWVFKNYVVSIKNMIKYGAGFSRCQQAIVF